MINARVRRVRKAKGIMTWFIAEQLGITRQQYCSIERGQAGIDSVRLARIAELLHEEPGIFFEDSLTDAVIERVKRGKENGNHRQTNIPAAARPRSCEEVSPSNFENRNANSE